MTGRVAACVVLSLVMMLAVGCDSAQSASEYAAELGAVATELDVKLDTEWDEFFAQPATVDGTVAFLETRVEGYATAVEGFGALRPPPELEEIHAAIMEFMNSLLEAERERAAFAATIDSVDDLDRIWEGPATEAVLAIEATSPDLCQTVQAEFDATHDRSGLSDAPWVSPGLRDSVSTVLGCVEMAAG